MSSDLEDCPILEGGQKLEQTKNVQALLEGRLSLDFSFVPDSLVAGDLSTGEPDIFRSLQLVLLFGMKKLSRTVLFTFWSTRLIT